MKRYILSIILCLCASCAGAYTNEFITMAASETDASPSGYSDSFTGADGTDLATHDSNWSSIRTNNVSSAKIISNFVAPSSDCGDTGARYTASTSDTSIITYKGLPVSLNVRKEVLVRAGSATNGYGFYLHTLSGANFTGISINKDNSELDASWGLSVPSGSDFEMKITAEGTNPVTVRAYINGSLVKTVTDSTSPIASGNPGFRIFGSCTNGYNFMDNWRDN